MGIVQIAGFKPEPQTDIGFLDPVRNIELESVRLFIHVQDAGVSRNVGTSGRMAIPRSSSFPGLRDNVWVYLKVTLGLPSLLYPGFQKNLAAIQCQRVARVRKGQPVHRGIPAIDRNHKSGNPQN